MTTASGKTNFSLKVPNSLSVWWQIVNIYANKLSTDWRKDRRRKDFLERWSWRIPGRKSSVMTEGFLLHVLLKAKAAEIWDNFVTLKPLRSDLGYMLL